MQEEPTCQVQVLRQVPLYRSYPHCYNTGEREKEMNLHVGPIVIATVVKRRQKLMDDIEAAICGDCCTNYGFGKCSHGKGKDCSLFKVTKLLTDMWDKEESELSEQEDCERDPDWEREND